MNWIPIVQFAVLPLLLIWAVWLFASLRLQKNMQTGWWDERGFKLFPSYSRAYRRRQLVYSIAFVCAMTGVFFFARANLPVVP